MLHYNAIKNNKPVQNKQNTTKVPSINQLLQHQIILNIFRMIQICESYSKPTSHMLNDFFFFFFEKERNTWQSMDNSMIGNTTNINKRNGSTMHQRKKK